MDGSDYRPGYEIVKRAFDLTVAVPLAILMTPVLMAIAVAIVADSPGPFLYRGRRVGRHGRPFDMYKFRTMKPGSDREGSSTGRNDPRVTRVGWFLRRRKLDELPQGFQCHPRRHEPRRAAPEVEEHTRDYDARERLILTVRPGLTDYSSLRFFNLADALGEGDPRHAHEAYVSKVRAQKNAPRLEYVLKRSFVEDLHILAKTAAIVARSAVRRKDAS